MDDILIQKLLINYKLKKKYDYDKYHNERKLNQDFIEKNRERSKQYYENHKEDRKLNYEKNRDLLQMKNLYGYYNRNDKLDLFKSKHKYKYDKLIDIGFIKHQPDH